MESYTVFTKTAKGLGESTGKTKALSRTLRKVLKEVDGQATVGEIGQRLDDVAQSKLMGFFEQLLSQDYIREFKAAPRPQVVEPSSADDLDFTTLGKFQQTLNQLTMSAYIKAVQAQASEDAAAQSTREPATIGGLPVDSARNTIMLRSPQIGTATGPDTRELADIRLREEADAKARREEEIEAAREAEAAKRHAEERARREEEARHLAEAEAAREAERKAQAERLERERIAAEEQARQEAQRKAAAEAEARERARLEAEFRAMREVEEKAQHEAEQRAREAAAEKSRRELQEQSAAAARELARLEEERLVRERMKAEAKREMEAKAAREAAAKAAAVERARQEEEARMKAERAARLAEEERLRAEAERKALEQERVRVEAERQRLEEEALRVAQEAARLEEEKRRREEEETAQAEAKRKAQEEDARIRAEAERRRREEEAQREALEAARVEDENRRREEEETARAAAELKAREEVERGRQEAEEKKRIEAEAARREAEERLRLDVEDRERRHEEARRQALAEAEEAERAQKEQERRVMEEVAAFARREEEERLHAELEARERQLKAERKRAEQEELYRRKAERKARYIAEKKAKKETRARARKEAAIAERQQRKTLIDKAKKTARTITYVVQSGWTPSVAKKLGAGAALAAVAGVGAVHLVSFDSRARLAEQAVSTYLRQPVKIEALHFSLLPRPRWRAVNVTVGIGEQIRAREVALPIGLGSDENIKRIDIASLGIKQEALPWLLWGTPDGDKSMVQVIQARDVTIDSSAIDFGRMSMRAEFASDGRWKQVVLDSGEKQTYLTIKRDDALVKFDFTASSFVLPFGGVTPVDQFYAKGAIFRDEIAASEFRASAYDGVLAGTARLSWSGDNWSLQGDFRANEMAASQFAPALIESGKLKGEGRFAMQAADSAKLFSTSRVEGSFIVNGGTVSGIDLMSSLKTLKAGGRSVFSEAKGNFSYHTGKTQIRDLRMSAGLLSLYGSAEAESSGALRGRFSLDLNSPAARGHGNISLQGTLVQPRFSQ